MTTRLKTILRTLSAEQRADAPFFSIYLDWSVDSNGQRVAMQMLEQELARIDGELPANGPRRESFDADRTAITRYLTAEAPSDARGIVLFARAADNIWSPIPLLVPVETHIAADDYPHLFQLAQLIDDHETYVVALVESQEAQVYVLGIESMEQVEQTQAREEVQRVQVGGWSQLRYENHTGYVIRLHMQDLAATLRQVMEEHEGQHLIIATNDAMKGPVREKLGQHLQEKLVDFVSYDRVGQPEQMFEQLSPLMQETERKQEQALVDRLHEQLNTKGGLAFDGPGAVAGALVKGQVDTLLISPNLEGEASECQTCGLLRVGRRETCPADGGPMLPVDLREGLVLYTYRQSGNVEIINLEDGLAEHGHVAALLRYRDDVSNAIGDGIA